MVIWYLLPCKEQEEQRTLDSCRNYLSETALRDAFILTYDRMCRYQGAWHLEKKLLFPAYVILESENASILRDELTQYKGILGKAQAILEINPKEEKFLRVLCGKRNHIRMSRGVICKGVTQVTEGPLKGMEARICKIDRHKRLAKLRVQEGQDSRYIPAGLEIVEKSI